VLAAWRFMPSAQLGGDAFGYFWLDQDTFVFYLIDVSGHGVGSAMHSVTVLNVLKQRALPHVSFDRPAEVLASLNSRFQMDSHGGLFFTMWYGVYRVSRRSLTYSSAGHPPASLLPPGAARTTPLGVPALMIGAMPDAEYEAAEATIAPGSSLYLFSDGVYEIVTTSGDEWSLADLEGVIAQPGRPGLSESERVLQAVKHVAGGGSFSDDFSLVIFSFP
jgi:serine phosphatase RsbU (regulator of sigma subunit)